MICLLGTLAGSALARPSGTPAAVTAVEAKNGHRLPGNPVLHRGEEVIVTAAGFAPGADVTVGLVGVQLFGTTPANGDGAAVYQFTVPRSIVPGQHALVFSGAARSTQGAQRGGNVVVQVPLTEKWPFRTPGRHGTEGTHAGREHGTNPSGTGTNVLLPLLLGLAAVLLGALVTAAGRRRRRRPFGQSS